MDFKELGLSDKTVQAVTEAGITVPTTVQADVIPSILHGKDVFTIAPAKCGKTYSYVLPLIDIIARKEAHNILIITSGAQQSVAVSDRFAVFNKYHEITAGDVADDEENVEDEANVIIASPKLLSDLLDEDKIDLSQINILVVDDINLIKKTHQLEQLEKVLAVLPSEKQNIVYTNRRSKETQALLDKILQTPDEIKINKDKEQEAEHEEAALTENTPPAESKKTPSVKSKLQPDNAKAAAPKDEKPQSPKHETKKALPRRENSKDAEALNLVKRYHTFGRNTPAFLLTATELAEDNQ